MPNEPTLRIAAQALGLITKDTIGLTLRYGIYIREDYWNDRETVIHELIHLAQYEKLGSIAGFLQKYLQECNNFGYPQAPMEQEARIFSAKYFNDKYR